MDAKAPEVDRRACRIDRRLERRLALAEHRGGVDHRAPTGREEVAGLEKHRDALGQAPARPFAPCFARRLDRRVDMLWSGLMDLGEHVPVAMWHDRVGGLARP